MNLSKKFLISFLLAIVFMASINIIAFYIFYSSYLDKYFNEKIRNKDSITIEYVNEIIKKQTIDDIDSIFSDTEIEFFELLDNNDGKIPLNEQKNIDTVINYLVKSWISYKYIEEIIPTDKFWDIIKAIKDKDTLEYQFIDNMINSIIITNIISILIIIFWLLIFIKYTILPIKKVTANIKKYVNSSNIIWKNSFSKLEYYNKKDEIWWLIQAINKLNNKIIMHEWIRTRLLADISHELKTPITSIQCYLEWINDWVIKLDHKNLNSITNEMTRLISLVNKIMEYEKKDRKKINLVITNENIGEILKWVVETHKKRLKENKQRIKITGTYDLSIWLDKNQFVQIVQNLIWNFLRYSWKKTLLKIIINKNYIEFTDNWIWISTAKIPFLTEKFYQWNIEKTWTIDNRWLGVWLSIISKIIISHNWKYEIKSDTNKWFSFKIYI